jgi:hypothetical protein
MNRRVQFLHCPPKVLGLKPRPRGVRDGRSLARGPTFPGRLTLVPGVVGRGSSCLELSTRTPRRQRCRRKDPGSDAPFEAVTQRLSLEAWRHCLAPVHQRLKVNTALESRKRNGRQFVSRDASEPFHSRRRCCAGCGQRSLEDTDADGPKRPVPG